MLAYRIHCNFHEDFILQKLIVKRLALRNFCGFNFHDYAACLVVGPNFHRFLLSSTRAKQQALVADKQRKEAEKQAEFEALPEWKKRLIMKQRSS